MGIREIISLIFALGLGGAIGCGVAFTFWGSILNRSNNHGDYVGESSKYTKGLKYSDRSDRIKKKDERELYISAHYKALHKDLIFTDKNKLVKRPLPKKTQEQSHPAKGPGVSGTPGASGVTAIDHERFESYLK